MTEENSENLSEKRRLGKEILEALQSVRSLFVASVALVITLVEMRPRADRSTALSRYKKERVEEPDPSLSTFELPQETSDSEPLEVSIEIDEPLNDWRKVNDFLKMVSYPLLATISTTAMVIGVIRLGPITQWASTQNECIRTSEGFGSDNSSDLPIRVMSCNGGHAN